MAKIKLTKKQTKALDLLDTHNEVIFGGGAGGAKSFLGCLWISLNCIKYPSTRWVIGRSKLKSLKETTLNTWFEVQKHLGIDSSKFKYNSQDGTITYFNGSVIILKDLFLYPSDPNFDSLGSLEITGAFVDECNQVVYKAWQILGSRIRYKLNEYNLKPTMLGTCNPSKGWVYTNFYKASKDGSIRKDRAFLQSLATDNDNLPNSYIEALKNLDMVSRERLLLGNWEYDDDPAKLIEYEKILDLYTNDYVSEGSMYIVADIATRGSDKFVVGVWSGFRLIKIFTEDKSTGKGIIEKMQSLANEYQVPNSNIVYDADGVGSALSGFIANTHEFKNGSKAKNGENYNNLKSQCYFKLSEMINEGKIYIGDKTEKETLTEELEYVKRDNVDKDGKLSIMPKDKVKEFLGRSPDMSDMLMMRMYFEVQGKVETFNPSFF